MSGNVSPEWKATFIYFKSSILDHKAEGTMGKLNVRPKFGLHAFCLIVELMKCDSAPRRMPLLLMYRLNISQVCSSWSHVAV